MAKRTMLKYVQLILSAMDSDEVETYNETVESLQVSDILEQSYFEIIDRRDWEFLKHRTRQLDADATSVVSLAIPSDVMHVELIRYYDYDISKYKDVTYVAPDAFLIKYQGLDSTQTNIVSATVADGVTINIYNDRAPTEWTSFDESTITFNAYDAANEIDGVSVASSVSLATIEPAWTAGDSFVPDLPSRMSSLLLNEALSACWLYVKQEANQKAEAIARRQFARMVHLERRAVKDEKVRDYGRKPRYNARTYTGR